MTRCVAVILAVLALSKGQHALADDAPLRMRSPATCTTQGGSALSLPPGVFLPEPTWLKLDAEVRRLQAEETRLGAENKKLRDLTESQGGRMLRYLAMGFVVGVAATAGVVAYYEYR